MRRLLAIPVILLLFAGAIKVIGKSSPAAGDGSNVGVTDPFAEDSSSSTADEVLLPLDPFTDVLALGGESVSPTVVAGARKIRRQTGSADPSDEGLAGLPKLPAPKQETQPSTNPNPDPEPDPDPDPDPDPTPPPPPSPSPTPTPSLEEQIDRTVSGAVQTVLVAISTIINTVNGEVQKLQNDINQIVPSPGPSQSPAPTPTIPTIPPSIIPSPLPVPVPEDVQKAIDDLTKLLTDTINGAIAEVIKQADAIQKLVLDTVGGLAQEITDLVNGIVQGLPAPIGSGPSPVPSEVPNPSPTETPTVPPIPPTEVPTVPPIPPTEVPTVPPIPPTEVPTVPPIPPTETPVPVPTVPTVGGLVDTVVVDSRNPFETLSNASLAAGTTYRLRVSGTYNYGVEPVSPLSLADAECAAIGGTFLPELPGHDPSLGMLELHRGGQTVNWTPTQDTNDGQGCSTTHTYELPFVGTGAKLGFLIMDDSYQENVGAITVRIYEGDPPTSQASLVGGGIAPLAGSAAPGFVYLAFRFRRRRALANRLARTGRA